MLGLTAAEVAVALLLAWLLTRSGIARHASRSAGLAAGNVLILVSALSCLAVMVFVLGVWQWRLRGRDRVRLLLASYLAMMISFFGLCWFDVSVRSAEFPPAGSAVSALSRAAERTVAAGVALGSLLAGLVAVAVSLWAARRALNPSAPGPIVERT